MAIRRYGGILFLAVTAAQGAAGEGASIYDFSVVDISGKERTLEEYRDKVLLIVNVASKCGFTPQYEGLESLYERYRDRGLVVLGFPANDFLWQEPGSDSEIAAFCRTAYGVSFPMFSKVHVKGRDIHPLYAYLTSKKTNPEHGGRVGWNFTKFLVGRDGRVIGRFDSKIEPKSAQVTSAVEAALGDR